ncbi:glycosyltransferase family 2 protein [Shewanella waksmanii]|uniref:glycosyltransferase family 2 protein n=1 Tax=Shewanella waksmanii TaxID=213783 RepID=UPI0037361397
MAGLTLDITAIINVKDEPELLRKNIEYHKKLGIKNYFIFDRSIEPFNVSLIRKFSDSEDIKVVVYHRDIFSMPIDSLEFKNRRLDMFSAFKQAFSKGWYVIMDADEFLVSKYKDISKTASITSCNTIILNRYNIASTLNSIPFYEQSYSLDDVLNLKVVAKSVYMSRDFMADNPSMPWIMHKVGPKMMSNIREVEGINPGFHSIETREEIVEVEGADLCLLHVPFTDLKSFANKVKSIRVHLDKIGSTFRPAQAWHWRRWAEELASSQDIAEEFDKQFFSSDTISDLESRGVIKKLDNVLISQLA